MRITAVILFLILLSVIVFADDFELGRKSGMAGGIMLSQPSASDLILCPSAFHPRGVLLTEAGFQRRYELSDLDEVFFAGGYGHENFILAVGFSQLGRSDYYVEQLFKGAVSYKYNSFVYSLSATGKHLEIGSDERKFSLGTVALGAAAGVHLNNYHAGITFDNLNRPRLDDGANPERIKGNIFYEVEGLASFSIVGRVRFEEYEKPILSIGQYFHVGGVHGIYWGLQSDPISYGGGIDVHYSGFSLTYAVSHHPVLGFTHNVSFNWQTGLTARE